MQIKFDTVPGRPDAITATIRDIEGMDKPLHGVMSMPPGHHAADVLNEFFKELSHYITLTAKAKAP